MKSHWIIRWVMPTGQAVEQSTRDVVLWDGSRHPETTEEEVTEAMARVLLDPNKLTDTLLPFVTVRDRRRGGQPTMVFLGPGVLMELERDLPALGGGTREDRAAELEETPAPGHRDLSRLKLGSVVKAAQDGVCDNCSLEVLEGDEVRSTGDDGWVHADCNNLD